MKKTALIRLAFIAMIITATSNISAQVIVVPAGATVVRSRPVVIQKHHPRYYQRSYYKRSYNHPAYYQVKNNNGKHKGWYKHKRPHTFKRHH